MGNYWFVQYLGGHYYASPNYVGGRLMDWNLNLAQNGPLGDPQWVRVSQNALIFKATAVEPGAGLNSMTAYA